MTYSLGLVTEIMLLVSCYVWSYIFLPKDIPKYQNDAIKTKTPTANYFSPRKVKQSRYRSGVAQKVPGSQDSQIS